jgi:RNA polymerase sigma factor (sigma-70 family)
MPSLPDALIRCLRRLPGSTLSDAALLHAFVAGDQEAFRTLVSRHGPLVLGVCRRVLGNGHAAEDAFQATFLVLARRAGSVRLDGSLSAWLFGVARRVALKARTADRRRTKRETRYGSHLRHSMEPADALTARELLAALDEELARLPIDYRDPLLLCYWQGLTRDQAARRLGCSAGAIHGRLERGRARLADQLRRRGFGPEALLVAPLAAAAMPGDLLARTAGLAAGPWSAAIPSAVVALAAGPAKLVPAIAMSTVVLGVGLLALAAGTGSSAETRKAAPRGIAAAAPTADAFGDPLPAGAVARLGTRRLCAPRPDSRWIAFSPDGTKIAALDYRAASVWDAATGRLLVEQNHFGYHGSAIAWRADGTGVAIVQLPDYTFFASAFTDPAEIVPSPPRLAAPPGNPKVAQIPGGPDVLDFVALSPDATEFATVRNPRDDQVIIDVVPVTPGQMVTGRLPMRTVGPFPGRCRELRYLADGRLVFLTGPPEKNAEWTISVVDPKRNEVQRATQIPPPAHCVWRFMLNLSTDGGFAAIPLRTTGVTNTYDGTIRLWDLAAGKELWKLPFAGSSYGTGHALTPDGKLLITSTDANCFRVWDVATGRETAARVPAGYASRQGAIAVAVSPDGKRFATSRRDGRLDIWDIATGSPTVTLTTHRDTIDAVAVSPDGRLAATAGFDGAVRVWEVATGNPVCSIDTPADGEPLTVGWGRFRRRPAFTPDGRGLLFTRFRTLALADATTGKPMDLPGDVRGGPGKVAGFTADGKTLATYAEEGVTLWDWPAGVARLTVSVPAPMDEPSGAEANPRNLNVNTVVLSPDGRFLLTSADGGHQTTEDLWDARTGKHLRRLSPPENLTRCLALSPDCRLAYLGTHSVVANGKSSAVALTGQDSVSGNVIRRFPNPPTADAFMALHLGRTVEAITVSPDGRLLAASEFPASYDVLLYETASGGLIKKLSGHARWATDLAFTPDGRRLISVGQDQTGLVWDVTPAALTGLPIGTRPLDAWIRLGASDAKSGYAAASSLVESPEESVAFLRTNLRPAPVPSDADFDRIINQLDAAAFADRDKAVTELERFGPNAVAGATSRLAAAKSAEVRDRLKRFLDKCDDPNPSPYQLRRIRAVAALEAIGTADARALLAELAKGPADDVLTREARAAAEPLTTVRFGLETNQRPK